MPRSIIFLVAAFIVICVVACTKTDTTKPLTGVTLPTSGQYYLTGDSIHFQATFSDNEGLSQYRAEVKNNFGGQATSLKPWQAIFVYDLEGSSQGAENYFPIPDTIASGWYLLIVRVADAKGNESAADTTPVFIQNRLDVNAPVIDISSPADSSVIAAADSIIISTLISDDLKLYKFTVSITNESDGTKVFTETKDNPGTVFNFYSIIHDIDTLSGWFKFSVSASDSMNNNAFAERKIHIQ